MIYCGLRKITIEASVSKTVLQNDARKLKKHHHCQSGFSIKRTEFISHINYTVSCVNMEVQIHINNTTATNMADSEPP